MNADFIGVKIGDVNGSVEANFESTNVAKRNTDPIAFTYQDQVVEKGESVELYLRTNDFNQISGMQFTLHHKGLLLETVHAGELEILESHIGKLDAGITSFSWNNPEGEAVTVKDKELFSLSFTATTRLRLSDVIRLNSTHTNAEGYQLQTIDGMTHYDIIDIIITPEEVMDMEEIFDFLLHQNEPNPWSQLTAINVSSEISGLATLSITDGMGRLVLTRDIALLEGLNEIILTKHDIVSSGMYFYSLTVNEQKLTKQMIKVE